MQCPICKKPVSPPTGDELGDFPFCSQRCRLVDLGRWLDGRYQIPLQEEDESPDEQNPPSTARH